MYHERCSSVLHGTYAQQSRPNARNFHSIRLGVSSQCHGLDVSRLTVFSVVEANLIIICICIPSLRPFIRHYAPSFMGSSAYGKSGPSAPTVGSRLGPNQHVKSNSRGIRAGRYNQYGMMSEFDDEIELRQTRGQETTVQAGHGPARVDNDDTEHDSSSEKAIWQTTMYSVRRE